MLNCNLFPILPLHPLYSVDVIENLSLLIVIKTPCLGIQTG
jgi:hypothetical protein